MHATSAATVCLCAQGKHSSHASNVQYAERYSIEFPKFPVQRLFPQQISSLISRTVRQYIQVRCFGLFRTALRHARASDNGRQTHRRSLLGLSHESRRIRHSCKA